jgi:hypothetical protein
MGARAGSRMPDNDWTRLERAWRALAAVGFGAFRAEQCLQRAWKEGALCLRGVPHTIPQTREVVEIPASEAGRLSLDCLRSRLGRPRLWDYHSVQVRKTDVERLVAEAGGTQAAASKPQEADTRPEATALDAQEAGRLTRAVARWLLHLFPDERPSGLSYKELEKRVRAAAGEKLGAFSLTTLKRAIRLAWPPGQTGPDAAKPGQPSR